MRCLSQVFTKFVSFLYISKILFFFLLEQQQFYRNNFVQVVDTKHWKELLKLLINLAKRRMLDVENQSQRKD